jgi:exonuclease SbcC
MKITKVELKNYRIHKGKHEWTFEKGINLLLGSNGSGKSSVLEAIGFALFKSDPRGNVNEIVSKGEKTGSVKVSFTGTDEKEYEIERKFGGAIKLTSSDSLQEWDGADVYKQVANILGIDSVSSVFFESIICAKQNKFIDIFAQSDAMRAKHFDKLFDTEIYNNLQNDLKTQNEDKYKEEKIRKEENQRTLASRQKNIADLENELKKQNEECIHEIKNLKILEVNLKDKKLEQNKYSKLRELVGNKEKEIKNSKFNITRFTEMKKINERVFEDSKNSKLLLEKHKAEFDKYESAKKQSEALEKDLQKLQQELNYVVCPILNEPCSKITKDGKKMENLQKEINEIKRNILNPMQGIYIKCLQNKKTADEYEARKKNLVLCEENIQTEMEKINKFSKELVELKASFSEEQLKLLDDAIEKLTAAHIGAIKKTESLKKDIEQKNKEIEACRKIEEEIKKLDSEIEIVGQKLNLTGIFRDKIKDLGRIVAEERVRRIADVASDYFNKITNRAETIRWICSESEKYSLYLDNGQDSCNFANLSGGEQISVAIAIRLALSHEFGNSGLIILDEPTNNLDYDRRQLLAENLPRMMENLSQLFVVTHDDAFRDTATNVIEFSEER